MNAKVKPAIRVPANSKPVEGRDVLTRERRKFLSERIGKAVPWSYRRGRILTGIVEPAEVKKARRVLDAFEKRERVVRKRIDREIDAAQEKGAPRADVHR